MSTVADLPPQRAVAEGTVSPQYVAGGLPTASDPTLASTLQLIAETIVSHLGFGAAVVNLVRDDQSCEVVAVAGPLEVRDELLHTVHSRNDWEQLMAVSRPLGGLMFIDGRIHGDFPAGMTSWTPQIPVSSDAHAWHPDDSLFAPLRDDDGRLLGILSVDLPANGLRPDERTCRALEAFAVSAGLALRHTRLASEARRDYRRFKSVFEGNPLPMVLCGPDRVIHGVNAAYCRFLARTPEELLGHKGRDFSHPADRALSDRHAAAVRREIPAEEYPEGSSVEKRFLRPDGSVVWGRLSFTALDDVDGPGTVLAQIEDITERTLAEETLRKQACEDPLTGLPNRNECIRELEAALERSSELGLHTAVLFCDLDKLKLVNDNFGHAVGDAYIVELAQRIKQMVRRNDVVGRLSGDEFIIISPALADIAQAERLADRIIDAVRAPLSLAAGTFTPSVSIGISFTGDSDDADALLADADAAMYSAKTESRGSWRTYQPSMHHASGRHLQLRSDFAQALRRDELVLHYQPIVSLRSGRVVGHEALLRWQHPTRGLLLPGDFLEVVLGSEFESPVTDFALRRACCDAMTWPEAMRRVTVNISSQQVCRPGLAAVIEECLATSGLGPPALTLELTEDRLLARDDGRDLLGDLKRTGVRLAIDDFGTGYSSLGYLKRFDNIDVVKLDRSFIVDVADNARAQHIIRATLDLARHCDADLVTEGVETDEQARMLCDIGVSYAQGYYFGRPVPLAETATGIEAAGQA